MENLCFPYVFQYFLKGRPFFKKSSKSEPSGAKKAPKVLPAGFRGSFKGLWIASGASQGASEPPFGLHFGDILGPFE